MFSKSIRLRFQIWLGLLLLTILGGFGFTAFQQFRKAELDRIDAQLERRLGALGSDLRGGGPGPGGPGRRFDGPTKRGPMDDRPPGRPPGPPPPLRELRLSPRTQNLFDEADTNSFYFVIWSRSGSLGRQSTNAPATISRPAEVSPEAGVQVETRGDFREAYFFTPPGDCILVGDSIADYRESTRRFAMTLLLAGAGVLFVGLGGGWALTTRALKPVEEISAAATKISGGNLTERINIAETDSELGQLANLLNSTFARLETAFAQQKQFTADAAHELRTPLAVLISETQTTLARPRTADEYRETVEACLETAQRMRALTHSLLELARFEAGQEQIERAPMDLAEESRKSAEQLEPLARERGIQIHLDLQPMPINGDAARIAQVIANLLTNAIHYNNDNGEVRITVRAEENAAVLTVSDTGQGIAADALPHIFERFYRADKSRTGGGRSGLGLAISKAIVEAHGGVIAVESVQGGGATFSVRIPRP